MRYVLFVPAVVFILGTLLLIWMSVARHVTLHDFFAFLLAWIVLWFLWTLTYILPFIRDIFRERYREFREAQKNGK